MIMGIYKILSFSGRPDALSFWIAMNTSPCGRSVKSSAAVNDTGSPIQSVVAVP